MASFFFVVVFFPEIKCNVSSLSQHGVRPLAAAGKKLEERTKQWEDKEGLNQFTTTYV